MSVVNKQVDLTVVKVPLPSYMQIEPTLTESPSPTIRTWRHDPYSPSRTVGCLDTSSSTGTLSRVQSVDTLSEMELSSTTSLKTHVGVELFKVKPCHALSQGTCTYGENCIYAHTPKEMRTRDANAHLIRKLTGKEDFCKVDPNKFKVLLCRKWAQHGHCPYAERCMYAHGPKEIRSVSSNREVARRMAELMAGSSVA